MKLVIMTICLVALLVGGCQQTYWVKPNATQEDFNRDSAQCNYEATKASYTPMGPFDSGISSGMQEGFQKTKVYKACMRSKGYKLTTTPSTGKISGGNVPVGAGGQPFTPSNPYGLKTKPVPNR